jgi:hypothetical protein
MYLGGWVCGMTCSATKRRAVRALGRRYTPDTDEVGMEEETEEQEEILTRGV